MNDPGLLERKEVPEMEITMSDSNVEKSDGGLTF